MNDLLNLKPLVLFWKINPGKATTGGEFDPARTVGLSLSQQAKDKPCQAVLIPYPVGFARPYYTHEKFLGGKHE